MVIDKPTGLAVHGGSGVQFGLIESLRQMFPDQRYMELVHRLDRDTSGLVMIAKRASVLRELHTHYCEVMASINVIWHWLPESGPHIERELRHR